MASEHDRRLAEYERQVTELQGQLKTLEEEVVVLRRRLQAATLYIHRVLHFLSKVVRHREAGDAAQASRVRINAALAGIRMRAANG